MRMWPVIVAFIVLVAVSAVIFGKREEIPTDIHAVSPEYRDLTASISTNGRVTPVNGFQARAAFAGMVEKIYVHVGQKVRQGQMLVKMKDPFAASRYTNAVAGLDAAVVGDQNVRQGGSQEERINLSGDLKHAEEEQADAANRLKLLKELQQKGDASAAEVSDAEHRSKEADTTLGTLRKRSSERYSPKEVTSSAAKVADARANVGSAKIVLANANITSSIAGTVYSIPVSTYDFVPMGADLLLIADLDAVQIRAYFDEPDIGQLRAGQPVDVFWNAKPGMTWHGRVEQPPLTVNAQGARNVGECIITVDNSNGDLLPNTNVQVKVMTDRHANVLSIPREALHTDGPKYFVYRVINGKIVQTPVTVGIVNLSFAEITGGLSKTDVVAVNTLKGTPMADGLEVRRVE